ncbi:MAG TPA: hypothetical protein VMU62_02595 [Acidobacteriaceae bacterium]|nr:hypothetical protein [Acidobacteriaceae bacterium]
MLPRCLRYRCPSLLRANVLVLCSLALAFFLAKFPANRPEPAMIVPILLAFFGTVETFRCLRHQWSFYHASVLISLYMDMMALTMILFLAFYPYAHWLM